jgi:5-methylcytosine-specific restriction endonuclease McrA
VTSLRDDWERVKGDDEELRGIAKTIDIYASTFRALERAAHRRAKKLGRPTEDVNYIYVYLRDAGRCYLCGEWIHYGPGKGADYLHFEHVISLKRGGNHSTDNVRISHGRCNQRKELHEQGQIAEILP